MEAEAAPGSGEGTAASPSPSAEVPLPPRRLALARKNPRKPRLPPVVPRETVFAAEAAPWSDEGTVASPSPSAEAHYVHGFLDALRAEYLQNQEGAVGCYYDTQRVPDNVMEMFDSYENRVCNVNNKEDTINTIAVELAGLMPVVATPMGKPTLVPMAAAAAVAEGSLAQIASEISTQERLRPHPHLGSSSAAAGLPKLAAEGSTGKVERIVSTKSETRRRSHHIYDRPLPAKTIHIMSVPLHERATEKALAFTAKFENDVEVSVCNPHQHFHVERGSPVWIQLWAKAADLVKRSTGGTCFVMKRNGVIDHIQEAELNIAREKGILTEDVEY